MYDLLKGLRVVEGSAFVAAPTCGLYLAQMGAEVIRFDNIGGGPGLRRRPPPGHGASPFSPIWLGLRGGAALRPLPGADGRRGDPVRQHRRGPGLPPLAARGQWSQPLL